VTCNLQGYRWYSGGADKERTVVFLEWTPKLWGVGLEENEMGFFR
jgi:hypothetical protein